jgi:hypothetical protein
VFQGETRRQVISALNALYDAGAITLLVLYELRAKTGPSIEATAGLFLGLAIFCLGGGVFYWRAVVYEFEAEMIMEEDELSESSQEIQTFSDIP